MPFLKRILSSAPNRFFAIFFTTILVTRLFLLVHPIHSPIIGDFHMHHYMYGLILIALGLSARSMPLYAIGMGLFADEVLLLHGINEVNWAGYFSFITLMDLSAVIVIVFFLRSYVVRPLEHQKVRRIRNTR